MVSISISKCPILLSAPPPQKKPTYNRKKKCHTVTKSGTFKIYCLDEPYFKNPENYADRKHRKLKQTSANPQLSVLTKNKIKWDINYSHVQTNSVPFDKEPEGMHGELEIFPSHLTLFYLTLPSNVNIAPSGLNISLKLQMQPYYWWKSRCNINPKCVANAPWALVKIPSFPLNT